MTFLLCDPGWYVHKPDVQNKWNSNTHRDEAGTGTGVEVNEGAQDGNGDGNGDGCWDP